MTIYGITSKQVRHILPRGPKRFIVGVDIQTLRLGHCWVDMALTPRHIQLYLIRHFQVTSLESFSYAVTAKREARQRLQFFAAVRADLRLHLKRLSVPWSSSVVIEPDVSGLARGVMYESSCVAPQAWWLLVYGSKQGWVAAFQQGVLCHYQAFQVSACDVQAVLRRYVLMALASLTYPATQAVTMGLTLKQDRALADFFQVTTRQCALKDMPRLAALGHALRGVDD